MVDDRNRSKDGAGAIDVVLVGAGERGRAWLETIDRAGRLRLVGLVARGGESLRSGVPTYDCIGDALVVHPTAAFALALPPRVAAESALLVAERGLNGVVEAPLHEALCEAELGEAGDTVRVAHGWTTLPGRNAMEKLVRRIGGGRISVEVAGLPEAEGGDIGEALLHGLALVRSLLPEVSVSAARDTVGAVVVELVSSGWTVELKVWSHGGRLGVRVEGQGETATWACEADRETLTVGAKHVVPTRPVPHGAARALAQLVTRGGDSLRDAADVLRLGRDVHGRLDHGVPPGGRSFRQSASIARRRPSDLLGRLGLRGEWSLDDAPSPVVLTPHLPAEPFELWAFRAGLKPVVFLTLEPSEVERTLACFGDVHCERRERRVSVSAQDRWDDRRDEGEKRVELYLSRDAAQARRAAHLQSEVDPSEAIRELGELVGYPSCCVEAFAQQDDRSNNSLNRYYSWSRTVASRSDRSSPWPWQLNNLYTVIAPFYPCTYRCERALAWSSSALEEMSREYPAEARALESVLSRPVLYFDHDHQIVFDGRYEGGAVVYEGVTVPGPAARELAAMVSLIGSGTHLTLDSASMRIERDGETIARFDRTDPALGFVAPFGQGRGK